MSMNLFKNLFAILLLTLTALAFGVGVPLDRSSADWLRLVISGFLGLTLADILLFEALHRMGASRFAIVDTLYAPLVVALSCVFLGESLTWSFIGGAVVVIAGIAMATIQRGALTVDSAAVRIGFLYGFASVACNAMGVILAKPVLEHSSLIEVTWTRLVIGFAIQFGWVAVTRQWTLAQRAFIPNAQWWTLIPAAFVGTYLSLMLWLGGFKWADASVAAVLNQMATVYILILARVILGETLRPAQVAGTSFAAAGALWIVLSRLS